MTESESAIIPLLVPKGFDLRPMSHAYHQRGLFVNSVEYPAVAIDKQRFRISVMATHTKNDLDYLVTSTEEIFKEAGAL